MGRARPHLLLVAVLGAAAILLGATNSHQRISSWLFWPYAGLWALTLLWGLTCLSVGHGLLRLLPPLLLPLRERLVLDCAAGTLVFALGVFVSGLFGLLRGPFCFVFPLLLAGLGAPSLVSYLRKAFRHFRRARRQARIPVSALRPAALALGTLGLTLVYLTVMTPDNIAFDAQTYHLAMAEGWAAQGRIGSFPEGWFPGAIPHLASWLYTWAFTFGFLPPFMRTELAAHMEFFLFVLTLAATPLLVEALCPRRRAGMSWVLYFLFPGLFLYDSSLSLASDHVLAFWAVPLALATRRVVGSWQPGRALLLGLMLAAAAMTKYQAVYLLVPTALVIVADVVRRLIRQGRSALRHLLIGPLWTALAALVAAAPHWLANAIWYGNPVYPMMQRLFPWSHPWVAGWKGPKMDTGWTPEGSLAERLWETSKAVFTFSFIPHDWHNFHRNLPVFGFLFTLSLMFLPFVRGARRVWLLVAGTLLGVFIWYWTYHQDRYLQILLPWMVACTAATLMLAWSSGRLVRIGLGLLVGLQLVWAGDIPFLPTHAMMGDVPAKRAITLLSSTYRGESGKRFSRNAGFSNDIANYLPKDAVVLLHEEYLRFGIGRRVVGDSARWQGGIHYLDLLRADRVFDRLKSYGVTHVVWQMDQSVNREIPLSGELVFFDFVVHHTADKHEFGRFSVAKMPAERPAEKQPGPVLFLGCQEQRILSLSELDDAVAKDSGSPSGKKDGDAERVAKLLDQAAFAVTREGCTDLVPSALAERFTSVPRWGKWTPWVRK